MQGLICTVYRDHDIDCSNGGLSSKFDKVTLVGLGMSGPFEPTDECPAVLLQRRIIGGKEYLSAIPLENKGLWNMFGGAFIYTSDSRFPNDYPIPLHDRIE